MRNEFTPDPEFRYRMLLLTQNQASRVNKIVQLNATSSPNPVTDYQVKHIVEPFSQKQKSRVQSRKNSRTTT